MSGGDVRQPRPRPGSQVRFGTGGQPGHFRGQATRIRKRLARGGWGIAMFLLSCQNTAAQEPALPQVIEQVQPALVKIFGGGGLRRLESWQTGFFVSDDGLIATVWSYILDNETTVVLDDGRRLQAQLVGYDPRSEIALLKADVQGQSHFNIDQAGSSSPGTMILAFSNLYGVAQGNEQCSVQLGMVSAEVPLNARRGVRRVGYQGTVLVMDAITSNPGSAGGVITDRRGRLLGMIGRESKGAASELWLNYAIPAATVAEVLDQIQTGRPVPDPTGLRTPTEPITLELLGIVLVPDVVDRTPPFVDQVLPQRAAASAGMLPDDLIVEVDGQVVTSCKDLADKLQRIDRADELTLMLQRGEDFLTVSLRVDSR